LFLIIAIRKGGTEFIAGLLFQTQSCEKLKFEMKFCTAKISGPRAPVVLEYSLSLTKTMYKVQTKILNNQIID